MQVTHGVKEGKIALGVVRNRILVIEHEQGVDHLPLHLAAIVNQLQCLADRCQSSALWVIRQALITAIRIRACRVGETVIGHGIVWLQSRCFLIGRDGLREIEAPGHAQALIIKLLSGLGIEGGSTAVSASSRYYNGQGSIRILGIGSQLRHE